MNDREYLRSLGFTVGDRGRFSSEMKAALASRDGITESDDAPQYKSTDKLADGRYAVERSNGLPSLVKPSTMMRDAKIYRARLIDGLVIACGSCGTCKDRIMYCECEDGPHPPNYLEPEDIVSWAAV
jgi:hypothetical protein